MFGLEVIMAGMLMSPQNQTSKTTKIAYPYSCEGQPSPQVNVTPSASRIQYNFTKSKADLKNAKTESVSPFGADRELIVTGLMTGKMTLRTNFKFTNAEYNKDGLKCLYLTAVNVTIHLDPTVYVAREYPQGGCMHNTILAHEMKHVNEDQYIANKYINEIGRGISKAIALKGASYGPYPYAQMDAIAEEVKETLGAEIQYVNRLMQAERDQQHASIDSLEEYESIHRKCKSRNKPRRK